MFDEVNKTEEGLDLPDTLFGGEEDTAAYINEAPEEEPKEMEGEEASGKATEAEKAAAGEYTARAREQIEKIRESVGLSGAWGNLFKRYPDLSREEASRELREAVSSGLTPLEAYQEKLLSEKNRLISAMEQNENAARRSVGSIGSDMGKGTRDDFLEGFFIDD